MAKEHKLRIGVIGVGGIGSAHCKGVGKIAEAELTAVADVDRKRAREIGKEYGVPHYGSHQELIESGRCDLVVVGTPHPEHEKPALDAIKAGLHVLCEKPVTERVSTARKVVEAAERSGVGFSVNFPVRTTPASLKAIEIAQSGQLGRLQRAILVLPDYRSQRYYDSAGWRATWKGEGGGILLNQAPHFMDFFLQLTGMPERVFGVTETRLHDIEVEDIGEALLRYPGGGHGYVYTTTNELNLGRMVEVVGSKGALVIRDGATELYRFSDDVEEFTHSVEDKWAKASAERVPFRKSRAPQASPLQNLVAHVLHGESLLVDGRSALWSLELANAIMLSSDVGDWVSVPIDAKAYDRFLAKKRRGSKAKKRVVEDTTSDPGLKARSAMKDNSKSKKPKRTKTR